MRPREEAVEAWGTLGRGGRRRRRRGRMWQRRTKGGISKAEGPASLLEAFNKECVLAKLSLGGEVVMGSVAELKEVHADSRLEGCKGMGWERSVRVRWG
jgi:hypothetical protein